MTAKNFREKRMNKTDTNEAKKQMQASDKLTVASAQRLIDTNCFGALAVTRRLLPLMRDNSRIVMVFFFCLSV